MNLDINNLDDYVAMLTDNLNLVDELSDDLIDMLIKHLESEISEKKKILDELKRNE